jgi:hypothetical protein
MGMLKWAAIVMRASVLALLLGWETFGTSTWAASLQGDASRLPATQLPIPQTTDDFLMEVAHRYPAFGGLFIGPDGVLRVYMLEDTSAARTSVKTAIADVYGRGRFPLDHILILKADYRFTQLKTWHDLMSPVVLALPGVVLTDIDEARNRLRVGVETLETQELVEEHLIDLGIPLDAVIVEEAEPVRFERSLRDRHRPLVGGLQISIRTPFFLALRGICTLGFNAIRAGVEGFVTNSHCTLTQGGVESTFFSQPFSRVEIVGGETVDPPYFTGAPCPPTRRCRFSDSAFAQRVFVASATLGAIAQPALNAVAWDGVQTYRIVDNVAVSAVGDMVEKIGRTTGRTQGVVTFTCQNLPVRFTNITLLCQNTATYPSTFGDSGSPVILPDSTTTALLYGIHWGSGGAFSPIANVQRADELGPLTTLAPE